MTLLQKLLAFIFAIGPLIVLHELGHYSVARLCGVKVLRFSVGFGKVLWSRRFGADQTQWALSALPLGGYVTMLDRRNDPSAELAPADGAREFTSQSVWRRIAIVGAGPLSNFLVAILLFAALYMHGIAEPASKIGAPAPASAAAGAGLRAGDTIDAINGATVRGWSALHWQVIQAGLDKTGLHIEGRRADGSSLDANLSPRALEGLDLEGDVAGRLGLAVARPPPLLGQVFAGGPGARAGLRTGDLVLAVDGQPVADGMAFIDAVRTGKGATIALELRRGGQPLVLQVQPDIEQEGGTAVRKIKVQVALAPEMVSVAHGPLAALGLASAKVWDTSAMTVKMMGKMVLGQASWKNMTGPISIADYAGQAASVGLVAYLSLIAFLSVSLGVMNLLPIPVLDGGVLLYYSLEVLTGRPVPERVEAVLRQLGVGLVLALMMLAMFNDLTRQLH